MQIDSASLLTNVTLIAVGVLAVGFLLWFLKALAMEKNGAHIRCRMECRLDGELPQIIERQPIRKVAARSRREDVDSVQLGFSPPRMLLTHRAISAPAQTTKQELSDEFVPTRLI